VLASWYTKFALFAEEDGLMRDIQIIGGWETFVDCKALRLGSLRPAFRRNVFKCLPYYNALG